MNSHTLLDVWSDLLQDLGGQENDGSGSVTNLGVLSTGNVDKSARSGVNNVEELEEGRSVVCLSAHFWIRPAHWKW